jgi:ATP-dependent DNA helicase RecG
LAVLAKGGGGANREELQRAAGLRDRKHFRGEILGPLVEADLIEMTIPDKPRSSRQRYRITAKGRAVLGRMKKVRQR